MADVIPVPGRRGRVGREPSPDPWPSQTERARCVVEGRRRDADDTGRCTVVAIRHPGRDGGVTILPHGACKLAVWLPAGAAVTLARFILEAEAESGEGAA